MIRYDLLCDLDHEFDGWYRDSETFDTLVKSAQVECPNCGSTAVRKALMAPALGPKQNQQDLPKNTKTQDEIVSAIRKIRAAVEANADYVGKNFAEEARKIHYKEAKERGIYGETTVDDAKSLSEEGIEIHPLPALPEDQN